MSDRNRYIRNPTGVALQRLRSENLLQIRCRKPGGIARRQTHRHGFIKEIMDLEFLNPAYTTNA